MDFLKSHFPVVVDIFPSCYYLGGSILSNVLAMARYTIAYVLCQLKQVETSE